MLSVALVFMLGIVLIIGFSAAMLSGQISRQEEQAEFEIAELERLVNLR